MTEYKRQPVKDWADIIAEKDAEIRRLRAELAEAQRAAYVDKGKS